MENYNFKAEENLLKLKRRKEDSDKNILKL